MRIPKLCHHKPSGRAFVRVDRKFKYLGFWGDPDTEAAYNAFVVEYLAGKESAIPKPRRTQGIAMRQLTEIYLEYSEAYFSAGEMPGIRAMTKRVNEVVGDIAAASFSPRMFKRVREAMIKAGNSRKYCNQQHNRMAAMLSYGVEQELIPASVPAAIREVKKLKPGRSDAKERPKVQPVPDGDILAAIECMPDVVAIMVQLQLLLGCRPGELWTMTPEQVDRNRDPWVYTPTAHKNAWREKERAITVGPHSRELLSPFLLRPAGELCFTSLTGRPWDRFSYRDAIHDACKLAEVPCWNPYQLRHNAGTEVRRLFGLEAVQSVLGHASRSVSEVYAAPEDALRDEVAKKIG